MSSTKTKDSLNSLATPPTVPDKLFRPTVGGFSNARESARISVYMQMLRKWWKVALAVVVLVIAAQIGVSVLVRTRRMHAYLVAHLERAFGRPVEVTNFAVQLLPTPQLEAEQVTVGEDPAFGNEYFLRADGLSAGLRWTGLLRGHFDFGTLFLHRPSLILVRSRAGSWNLERWLPPAKISGDAARVNFYGPPSPAPPVNRLQRIDFDDGRVNFKDLDEKLPFAFIGVSGSVDQVAPGRWQLRLEAQPWRSGAVLQSAGTLRVQGALAGTSARLQPAQIQVHWENVSLADFFRLVHGSDHGVRGSLTLDGLLKSGVANGAAAKNLQPGEWSFVVQARAAQIHRWDLSERSDNPQLRFSAGGSWNVAGGAVRVEQISIEAPRSNLRGTATYHASPAANFELHLDSAGIQAADLLAWLRAFHAGVDDGITAEQFFTGAFTLRGWPLDLQNAAFSSNGGVLRVPGVNSPIRIGPVRGGRERDSLVFDPVRVALGGTVRDVIVPKRRRIAALMENAADVTFVQDLNKPAGSISVEGRVQKSEDLLKAAAAFGRPLNHGWELSGDALAVTRWEWQKPFEGQWSGRILFSKAKLAMAGLNQPLNIQASTLNLNKGLRSADLTKVNGFGGSWSGSIGEVAGAPNGDSSRWNFKLAADHLNAAELDRWVGPRARPNWVERLLASFVGGSSPNSQASALLRSVNAEGDVDIGELTVEKMKFANVHATASLRDLKLEVHQAQAQWAGGAVRAQLHAAFSPQPKYKIAAALERVNLAEVLGTSSLAKRLAGMASGTVQLETQGVGRQDLLEALAGSGDIRFKSVEFRGWDVNASVVDGAPHAGTSLWTSGAGTFTMRNRSVTVPDLVLESGREQTSLRGTVSFARDADLTIETSAEGKKIGRMSGTIQGGQVLKISGPLDGPRVSVEKVAARQRAN